MNGTAHPYNSENYIMSGNDCKPSYEETFYITPRRIRKIPGITLAYLDVYETIFQFWNKQLPCYLSNATIQERTGHGHTVVSDALKFFEEHEELERKVHNGRRYLIQTMRIIETDIEDTHPANAAPPSRKCGTPHPANAVHNIKKETNKEITTTTCSSSFNPFENKCLEFKHSTDERTNEEFLENVHHHIKLNSDPDAAEYLKQQMLLKLLRNLHQSAAHFKSKGFVSKETKEETRKQSAEQLAIQNHQLYVSRLKSDITLGLLPSDTIILPFEKWNLKNVPSK